jgi:Ca2+-binding EF-hand superfamily protein
MGGGASSRGGQGEPKFTEAQRKRSVAQQKTITDLLLAREAHVELVGNARERVPKEKVRDIYHAAPSDLFDSVYGMFDWSIVGEPALPSIKMFSLMLISLMVGASQTMEERIDLSFNVFDIDGDGTLGREEFRTMLRAMLCTREMTLRLLMKSKGGRESLLEFAAAEFSDENIVFIKTIEEWVRSDDHPVETAASIIRTHVTDGAPSPVNLSAKTRRALMKAYKASLRPGARERGERVEDGINNVRSRARPGPRERGGGKGC